ncbi:hypothetical protein BpHYR1_034262 [Brachionus plicatilis]|uniref:Uncharacterized protein n=1 Tax=Brachionus plicatilis TaxID=10195 RepID=A0A3M7R4Y5_BRAPC|nr:hypothetical protein BpHYR1_034262 [Brachionus plicatilis]
MSPVLMETKICGQNICYSNTLDIHCCGFKYSECCFINPRVYIYSGAAAVAFLFLLVCIIIGCLRARRRRRIILLRPNINQISTPRINFNPTILQIPPSYNQAVGQSYANPNYN